MDETTQEVTYAPLEGLMRAARARGAKRIDARGLGWVEGPGGPSYQARALLVTADDREVSRDGYARAGDGGAPNSPPADADRYVEARAEARALRAALRTAYPEDDEDGRTQSRAMVALQALMQRIANVHEVDRDAIAGQIHAVFNVDSTADLTDAQCDAARAWLNGLYGQGG